MSSTEKCFLIADLHFGDERIIQYENRPFETVEDMRDKLIDNWNRVVSENDTVFVLGDFSCCDASTDQDILAQLKGRKILIMGNHDRHRSCEEWRSLGFHECVEWPILFKDFFVLSHEPIYLNANMPYANYYGHVHSNPSYNSVSRQSFCLSAERINYTPILFDEVVARCKEA